LVHGIFRAAAEKRKTINLNSVVILRKAIAAATSSFILLTALVFYWAPYTQSLKKDINMPRPVFDVITSQLVQKIGGLENLSSVNSLSSAQRSRMEQQQDELYNSVNQQLGDWLGSYKKFIPAIIALSVFFTLRFIGLFLAWPAIFLAWLAYRILLLSKIIRISKVQVDKEIIEI